jgi:hypothetical protein
MDPQEMLDLIDVEMARITTVLTERNHLYSWHRNRLEMQRYWLGQLRVLYEADLMPDEGIT